MVKGSVRHRSNDMNTTNDDEKESLCRVARGNRQATCGVNYRKGNDYFFPADEFFS